MQTHAVNATLHMYLLYLRINSNTPITNIVANQNRFQLINRGMPILWK